MVKVRHVLVALALASAMAGCKQSPVASASNSVRPRFDVGGQTLGSGHRNDGASSTTATAPGASVAADSLSSGVYGGQTLGSGH
jgi:hypothetical protein